MCKRRPSTRRTPSRCSKSISSNQGVERAPPNFDSLDILTRLRASVDDQVLEQKRRKIKSRERAPGQAKSVTGLGPQLALTIIVTFHHQFSNSKPD